LVKVGPGVFVGKGQGVVRWMIQRADQEALRRSRWRLVCITAGLKKHGEKSELQ